VFVGFAGSRSLPSVPAPGGLVARVVGSVVAAGRPVAVGCAVGADAAVLSARLALPFSSSSSSSSLVLFAAGGPSAGPGSPLAGFWRGSALSAVSSAAALAVSPGHGCFAPVSVRWWAGGPASLPLRRRLRARSLALVSFLAARPGSALVAFVAPGRSVGTWGTVRAAVAAGVPVFVFPVGGSALLFPPVGSSGAWVGLGGSGAWSRAFRFASLSAAAALFTGAAPSV